jgi:hypothetical protein
MEVDQARKIIAVLEEIRDGQKEALARQAETMALLRERMASAQERTGRVDQLLVEATQSQAPTIRLVRRAAVLRTLTIFLALLFVLVVWWFAFGRLPS